MNIKIIDGYVNIDDYKVSATYNLFTKEGIDICIPPARQPAPADPWVNPNEKVATIGSVNQRIFILLESLARRFTAVDRPTSANICRAEKENWK